MAKSKTIWRGQSANFSIEQIQGTTAGSGHIGAYVFNNTSVGHSDHLTGVGDLASPNVTITANTDINSSYIYTVEGYLKYTHNAYGGSLPATSNVDTNTLEVREPLDNRSVTGLSVEPNEVWSNATPKDLTITPAIAYQPYKLDVNFIASQVPGDLGGGSNNVNNGTLGTTKLKWESTLSNKDLGAASKNIEYKIQSIADLSAPTSEILTATANLKVKNAVTALSAPTRIEITNGVSTPFDENFVTITPLNPYSESLFLTDYEGNQLGTGQAYTGPNNIKLMLAFGKIVMDASDAADKTIDTIFEFKVCSTQGAQPVYTDQLVWKALGYTDKSTEVVEGQTVTIELGIGTLNPDSLAFTGVGGQYGAPISVTVSNDSIIIHGEAVTEDTSWELTIENMLGSVITVTGTTKFLSDVSVSINTGDNIVIGSDVLTGLTEAFEIVAAPIAGVAYISDGKLFYEATNGSGNAIANGTYAIEVKGANGATQTVNVVVSDITLSVA